MILNLISGLLIHQTLNSICYIRNCDCITNTLNLCGSKLCRVDTNNLTVHVQKSTAAVARIDCCICLDQIGNCIHCVAVNIVQGNCNNCKVFLAVITFYLSFACCTVAETNG